MTIDTQPTVAAWQSQSSAMLTGLAEWRAQHPRATLREIEAELDQRWAVVRAKLLADTAALSAVRSWTGAEDAPLCPTCGVGLQRQAKGTRQLQTQGGQTLTLERAYGRCPQCGEGFFPPG